MIFLGVEELLHIAETAVGGPVRLRDAGLLEAAAHRPATVVAGSDAYPDLVTKAAALLHSLARNHPLVDGNKRLALAATVVFLGVNGARLTASNDEAYDLVIDVATSALPDVEAITARLRPLVGPVGVAGDQASWRVVTQVGASSSVANP